MNEFITAEEVASLVGFAQAQGFLAARQRLEHDEGFPLPMPTCRRPLKWRRTAVTAWVEEQCQPREASIVSRPANVTLLSMARTS